MPTTDTKSSCGANCALDLAENDPEEQRRSSRAWWGIGLGAVLAGNSMMFGLAINTSEATPAMRQALHWGLLGAALLTSLLLGPPLLAAAWHEMRRRRLTIEALFLTGLAGTFAISLISMFSARGPVYFETVIILLVVYSLGRQLTRSSQRRARRSIQGWRGAPQSCERLAADGAVLTVPVEQVGIGDCVRVHPGRVIPVDGAIARGEAFIQQAQLTGEFFSVRRGVGDSVLAGSVCIDGTLVIRTTAPGNARRIDHLARAVELARLRPSSLENEADRLVRWFLPLVLMLASLTFAFWSYHAGWQVGLMNAMAVLFVSCPCAMGFATPVSVAAVIARLAQRGLIPHRGDLIETLAAVDTVVFDKTGTLTEPRAMLADLVFAPDAALEPAVLRRLIAAVQRASDHPIAGAFRELDAGLEAGAAVQVLGVRALPGRGVAAECRLDRYDHPLLVEIGSEDLIEPGGQRGAWDALCRQLAGSRQARRVAVRVDGQLAAVAAIDERPIETGPATLRQLDEMGLHLMIMTGDRIERAGHLGLSEIHADLAPEDKQRLIYNLRRQKRTVLFIGDGINDAVAMAESHASLALASGAPLAIQTASAVLMEPDLTLVPWAIRLCRRARRTITQNLYLAAAYNAVGIGLACAGVLHPVVAAVLMTCSSLAVSLRSLRLLDDQDETEAIEAVKTLTLDWNHL